MVFHGLHFITPGRINGESTPLPQGGEIRNGWLELLGGRDKD